MKLLGLLAFARAEYDSSTESSAYRAESTSLAYEAPIYSSAAYAAPRQVEICVRCDVSTPCYVRSSGACVPATQPYVATVTYAEGGVYQAQQQTTGDEGYRTRKLQEGSCPRGSVDTRSRTLTSTGRNA